MFASSCCTGSMFTANTSPPVSLLEDLESELIHVPCVCSVAQLNLIKQPGITVTGTDNGWHCLKRHVNGMFAISVKLQPYFCTLTAKGGFVSAIGPTEGSWTYSLHIRCFLKKFFLRSGGVKRSCSRGMFDWCPPAGGLLIFEAVYRSGKIIKLHLE